MTEQDREINYMRREIEALKKRNEELASEALEAFERGWNAGARAVALDIQEYADSFISLRKITKGPNNER